LAVCGLNGYVGRWSLPTYAVIKESILDENISYHSLDFVHQENQNDQNLLALAGSMKDVTGPPNMNKLKLVRVLNSKDLMGSGYIYKDLYLEGPTGGLQMDALGRYT